MPNSWYGHLVPLLPKRVIVTCHDLIELQEMREGTRRMKPHRRFHAAAGLRGIMHARRIVCDTRAVAGSLSQIMPECSCKIDVVPLGISSIFRPGPVDEDVLTRLRVRRPYVLYVGSEQRRKNVARVAAAIAVARRHMTELSFVKVGASQTDVGRAELMDALERGAMHGATTILEHVSDNELVNLYRGAVALLFPSLREGFGYPPLEAMACGCPAIVSNVEPLLETTGGEALTVDPLDVQSMAEAIEAVGTKQDLRQERIAGGIRRAAAYTWDKAAGRYADIYQEVASSS